MNSDRQKWYGVHLPNDRVLAFLCVSVRECLCVRVCWFRFSFLVTKDESRKDSLSLEQIQENLKQKGFGEIHDPSVCSICWKLCRKNHSSGVLLHSITQTHVNTARVFSYTSYTHAHTPVCTHIHTPHPRTPTRTPTTHTQTHTHTPTRHAHPRTWHMGKWQLKNLSYPLKALPAKTFLKTRFLLFWVSICPKPRFWDTNTHTHTHTAQTHSHMHRHTHTWHEIQTHTLLAVSHVLL